MAWATQSASVSNGVAKSAPTQASGPDKSHIAPGHLEANRAGGWVKFNPGDPTALTQMYASLCTAPVQPPTLAPNKLNLSNCNAATTCLKLAGGLIAPYTASRLHAIGPC